MASYPKKRTGTRDNFSQAVLKILCRRAGGKCCKCGATTLGPVTNNPYQTINIGKGAHIAAAASGGPRYDKNMTPEERSSATNGLWLCSNCHDQVDRDPDAYPDSTLQNMKKQHELRIRKELGVASSVVSEYRKKSDLIVGISSTTILDIRRTKCHFLESLSGRGYHTPQASLALGGLGYIDVEEDEYCEEVGWELLLLFHQVVAHCRDPGVTLEVIRRIKSISDRYQQRLDRDKVQLLCDVIKMALIDVPSSKSSRVFQSGLALLRDVSMYPALRDMGLHHMPQQLIRKTRLAGEHVDGETDMKVERKKIRLSEEAEEEESGQEKYLELMGELLETTDLDKTLQLEQQLEDLGYTPYVQ